MLFSVTFYLYISEKSQHERVDYNALDFEEDVEHEHGEFLSIAYTINDFIAFRLFYLILFSFLQLYYFHFFTLSTTVVIL